MQAAAVVGSSICSQSAKLWFHSCHLLIFETLPMAPMCRRRWAKQQLPALRFNFPQFHSKCFLCVF